MAHKSKKKHIKHLHQHDHDASLPPPAKNPGTKATSVALGAQTSRKTRLTSTAKAAANVAAKQRAKAKAKAGGLRSMAKTAAKQAAESVAAKPKRIISRAKARVRKLLGRERASE
jgi:hypothetical protein